MLQPSNSSRSFWLTLLALTFIINAIVAWFSYVRWNELGVDLFRSVWGFLFVVYLGMMVASVWLSILITRKRGFSFSATFQLFTLNTPTARLVGWLIFLVVLILIPYVKFTFRVGRSDENPLHIDPALMSIIFYWMCWYVFRL
jgi:hypothetical protein